MPHDWGRGQADFAGNVRERDAGAGVAEILASRAGLLSVHVHVPRPIGQEGIVTHYKRNGAVVARAFWSLGDVHSEHIDIFRGGLETVWTIWLDRALDERLRTAWSTVLQKPRGNMNCTFGQNLCDYCRARKGLGFGLLGAGGALIARAKVMATIGAETAGLLGGVGGVLTFLWDELFECGRECAQADCMQKHCDCSEMVLTPMDQTKCDEDLVECCEKASGRLSRWVTGGLYCRFMSGQ